MELRWITAEDPEAVAAAAGLFDDHPRPEWSARFLEQANHHLCIAYEAGRPVGFVSGVATTHPDKGTEMFLYELGVEEELRGRGIGRALAAELATRARDLGCYGMWVLTEADNEAALATYRSAGAGGASDEVMLTWSFVD